MKLCYVLALLLAALTALTGWTDASAQQPPERDKTAQDTSRQKAVRRKAVPQKAGPLFTTDAVLSFTLTAPFRTVLRDRGDTPSVHSARLTSPDSAGGQPAPALPVKLSVRGNFRRKAANCAFPPLLIDVPKAKSRNTVFAQQNRLKLVTHCRDDDHVLREYQLYKLYNLLTDFSFRARLARVTYVDSAGKRPPETKWAFLLEDDGAMARRNRAVLNNRPQTNMGYVDSTGMATVAVFAYMIGNTDWSVPFLHNIKLIVSPAHALPVPVPYDFDYSGIMETGYALPPPSLGIQSVRERLYRGPAYPMGVFERVIARFNALTPQIYSLNQTETR